MKPSPKLSAVASAVRLGLALALVGCATTPLRKKAGRESFAAVVQQSVSRRRPRTPPRLVLFSDEHAVGVDLDTGEELWRRPVRAFGPAVTWGDAVVVPVYGHRAIALDATTGRTIWHHDLPGQVLTGLAVSERWVVVTALASEPREKKRGKPPQASRSVVAAMSMFDGRRRWSRRSDELLGVPEAVGQTAYVPRGDRVFALNTKTGRVRSSRRGTFDRVERHGDTVLASDGEALVDLAVGTRYEYEQHEASLYERVDGIEHGMGHDGGLQFRLLPAAGAGAPRNALFLGRRAVLFVRLDDRGRAVGARWAHVRFDQHEYIDMHAGTDSVLLVREDGAVVRLDRDTGRLRDTLEGVVVPRGSAFAGEVAATDDSTQKIPVDTVTATLTGLVEDPDPRLVPAQRLALELMWRNERSEVRRYVRDTAAALTRPPADDAAQSVIGHAQALIATPWGRGDVDSVEQLVTRLQDPSVRGDALEDAVRETVNAGSPKVVVPLVKLLDRPSLSPAQLELVTKTLRQLERTEGIESVAEFVLRYHADPQVASESKALFFAADLLLIHALPEHLEHTPEATQTAAADAIETVWKDEFTVPALRQFVTAGIEERIGSIERYAQPDRPAPDDDSSPEDDDAGSSDDDAPPSENVPRPL